MRRETQAKETKGSVRDAPNRTTAAQRRAAAYAGACETKFHRPVRSRAVSRARPLAEYSDLRRVHIAILGSKEAVRRRGSGGSRRNTRPHRTILRPVTGQPPPCAWWCAHESWMRVALLFFEFHRSV